MSDLTNNPNGECALPGCYEPTAVRHKYCCARHCDAAYELAVAEGRQCSTPGCDRFIGPGWLGQHCSIACERRATPTAPRPSGPRRTPARVWTAEDILRPSAPLVRGTVVRLSQPVTEPCDEDE